MSDTADMIGAIVNAGKTAWDIVKDGKATSSAASSYCSAVPEKVPFNKLYGWKKKTGTWDVIVENFYGWDVIDCKLKYSFQYGGRCDDFPGALFMTNFSVYSPSCSVSWGVGFDVDATTRGKAFNSGSKKKVVGACPLLVRYSASGLNNLSTTIELTARGDGSLGVS